jgi:hypothetical protein
MSEKTMMQTSSLYDYLNWRGDLSFENVPFGEVDSLILSMLTYIDYTGLVPETLNSKKPHVLLSVTKEFLRAQNGAIPNMGLIIPKETVTLLARTAKTARFGLIRPFAYVNKICDESQKQFSAISFLLTSGDTFIAFRGTDDTLVGWKENFNMSFMHPVPSQMEAVEYLEYVAEKTKGKILLGGHSKGGNLAVYAAVKASKATQERIAAVYSNDAPGFDTEFIGGEDYKAVRERIYTFVPQSSVVGMLLEHEESYTVVKSRSAGLLQHNGFSWEVMGGSFVKLDDVDEESKLIDRSIKDWLVQMPSEERAAVIDSIYEAISATNAKTLTDLSQDKIKIVKAWNSMDNDARNQVRRCINIVFGKKKQQKEVKDIKESKE